jgi:hypothetical protein
MEDITTEKGETVESITDRVKIKILELEKGIES